MLRITRQADYGLVLLTYLARERRTKRTMTAAELARRTALPQPTVTKVLKLMTRQGLLRSQRGVQGGYRLARDPQQIDVAQVITALDGPIAVTQCSPNADRCPRQPICPVQPNWQRLDRAIREALEQITLAEIAAGAPLISAVPRSDGSRAAREVGPRPPGDPPGAAAAQLRSAKRAASRE